MTMQFDLDFTLTMATLIAFTALAGWMIVLEKRPPAPDTVRLVPTTPVLFLCMLAIVLALAHLVSIVTGSPHVGRLG